jgi:hypothetical protein
LPVTSENPGRYRVFRKGGLRRIGLTSIVKKCYKTATPMRLDVTARSGRFAAAGVFAGISRVLVPPTIRH